MDILSGSIASAALVFSIGQFLYQHRRNTAQDAALAAEREVRRREIDEERGRRNDEIELVHAHLEDIQSRRRAAERRQAQAVEVEVSKSDLVPDLFTTFDGDWVYQVTVRNLSNRPIRNVRGGLRFGDNGCFYGSGSAYVLVRSRSKLLGIGRDFVAGSSVPLMNPGDEYMILFAFGDGNPVAEVAARFDDDAGLAWQRAADLKLTQPNPVEWPDVAM